MKLLLDTHIWLWIHRDPWKLTSEVNQSIADPENDLWLSPVSVWELVVLLEKKRVTLTEEMNVWVEKSKKELSLQEAPFSWAVADELRYTILEHRDPAERHGPDGDHPQQPPDDHRPEHGRLRTRPRACRRAKSA